MLAGYDGNASCLFWLNMLAELDGHAGWLCWQV
jgi:hypothetical protein